LENHYSNGQLQSRIKIKDGKRSSYEGYHLNGQVLNRGIYKNGNHDGIFETFDENGNLTKTEEWKDGVLQF
jgi:antitoxin component YwqK of YwqJK toxin-antitoxin module